MNVGKLIKGYLAVIASAVIYGCMPLMAKYIYLDGVNPMTLVFLRNTLALPVLVFLTLRQQKSLRISVATLPSILIMALLGCCITPILLFSSYSHISSGTATIWERRSPVILGRCFSSTI